MKVAIFIICLLGANFVFAQSYQDCMKQGISSNSFRIKLDAYTQAIVKAKTKSEKTVAEQKLIEVVAIIATPKDRNRLIQEFKTSLKKERATSNTSRLIFLYKILGIAYHYKWRMRYLRKAQFYFDEAIKLDKENCELYLLRAEISMRNELFYINKCLELDSTNVKGLFVRAKRWNSHKYEPLNNAKEYSDLLKNCLKDISKCLEQNPNKADYILIKANILMEMNKYQEAFQYLNHCIERRNSENDLSELICKIGMKLDSFNFVVQFVERIEENGATEIYKELLLKAEACFWLGAYEKVINIITRIEGEGYVSTKEAFLLAASYNYLKNTKAAKQRLPRYDDLMVDLGFYDNVLKYEKEYMYHEKLLKK